MENILIDDIEFITKAQKTYLKKANIFTVSDLLFNYPNKFEDYTIKTYDESMPDENVTIEGSVCSKVSTLNVKANLNLMSFWVEVNFHQVRVSIFNRSYLRSKLGYGTYVKLTGKFNENKSNFTCSEIHFVEFGNAINPVFNIKGISDSKMLEIKKNVYNKYSNLIVDCLPNEVKRNNKLISLKNAIKYINIPEDIDEVKSAINRIKFEELFLYQLKVKYLFDMRKKYPEGVSINYDEAKVQEFIDNLSFTLTVDQEKCVKEILNDMHEQYQMNRLLQGEVGSGKTIVSAICLYAAITAGYQGAIMAPTEVLAQQHYLTFTETFKDYDVKIEFLSGSLNSKKKKEVLDRLQSGDIDLIIGTHSLIQKDVNFHKLGLVVTDEEHRFGVKQRMQIIGKGYLIDHLKMSATPIPRTLAISLMGDNDFSTIKSLPNNRKEPITKYVDYEARREIFDHMEEEIKNGHQIYIITPMINESETMDLNNATKVYENTRNYFKDICETGLIHGKLTSLEKEQIMNDFALNKFQILVSTSLIEVGVNVPNATTIVILDADRFGIAQLHQMRGRVRRSSFQSYCYLVSKSQVESSINRLKKVEANSDGFVLAEEDLITRGSGDIFSEKQTGQVAFKMADILDDKEIFEKANIEAERIINSDLLYTSDYKLLYNIVDENYRNKKELLN